MANKSCLTCEYLGKIISLTPNNAGRNLVCIRYPEALTRSLEYPYCGEYFPKETEVSDNSSGNLPMQEIEPQVLHS